MINLYLKFINEAQAESVLYRMEGIVVADPEMGLEASDGYKVANFANIDVLGVIYDMADAENPVALDGWHVNIRLIGDENGSVLEPFAVIPTNPRRVWA